MLIEMTRKPRHDGVPTEPRTATRASRRVQYLPALGRFLQPDPIGYGDGLNWYAYVGGDPVNNVDPFGLSCADGSPGGNDHDCRGAKGGHIPNSPYAEPEGPPIIVTRERIHGVTADPVSLKAGSTATLATITSGAVEGGGASQNDEFCQALAKEDTGKGVGPFIRNFPNVWNDVSQLKFHENNDRQMAEQNEAFGNAANVVGLGGGGVR